MEYTKLGMADLNVSRIGFGCWAIGGHGYGKVRDSESVEAIREALRLGINFFDTADVYGFGHSEEVLSKALGRDRKNVVIATKFGVSWNKDGKTFKDCSKKRIAKALDDSLKRLRLDCIPLYQIHWNDEKTPIAEIMESLQKHRDAGKIKHIGCTNFTWKLIEEASVYCRIESLQCRYHIAERANEPTIKKCSEKLEMGIIAYEALGRGLFSGKYDLESKFMGSDTRKSDSNFKGEKFRKNLRIAEILKLLGRNYAKSPSQTAIRWVLDNPHVTCVIVGIKNKAQVHENIGALSWGLKTKERRHLEEEIKTCIQNHC